MFTVFCDLPFPFVNGAGSVYDQKTSKFLSCREEFMAGHMGVNGIY
jgi:hypothetical protein